MSNDELNETSSFFPDHRAQLRQIAENPAAFTQLLSDYHSVLMDMRGKIEVLSNETHVHCKNTRVEGDKWGQAALRARPVAKALKRVIKDLESLMLGLQKSAHTRHAHDEKIAEVGRQRKEKALAKERAMNPPAIPAPPQSVGTVHGGEESGYTGPSSIFDLNDRRSA
ncbi:hypothetical protein ACFQ7J_27280 [Streptomyces sp. NPDC056501]|uniref:hypothetical protein n=1 Tax=Streptomyces sp. NPDC056501 TaxID=3345841 RepID=UPI003682F1EB